MTQANEHTPMAEETSVPPAGEAQGPGSAALEEQIKQLKEQLLYAMADTENLRKRHMKEKEDLAKFAVSGFSRDMLAVADNLDLALASGQNEDAAQALKNLVAGIELTAKELQSVFERYHIRKLVPQGEPFNPNFHQAVAEVPTADHAPGTVIQVMQAGYVVHDRLLRPAMVMVAKQI